ncbi:hypothetical protein M9H77_06928 [Catharanthus roseus]|uniref:Uncharacterized protein n=1 Tax=Catharanthus roseus TaxID=4058 RepID=A0ACC0BTQ8_CATRO|nr:hypothetical protein M9H77_06928 [Catharanthus roseus]
MVPLPSSGSRPGRGKGVRFLRDIARSETGFGSYLSVRKKKARKGDDDSLMLRGPASGGPRDPVIFSSYDGHVVAAVWVYIMYERPTLRLRGRHATLSWTPTDPYAKSDRDFYNKVLTQYLQVHKIKVI